MWRKMILGLCATILVLFSLVASASVHAKNLGSRIKVPPGGSVQMLNNGHFHIKGGLGLTGSFSCTCDAKGGGTCEVSTASSGGTTMLICDKGKAGTCKGTCYMTTSTTGIQ
jgi:hypothetical protein